MLRFIYISYKNSNFKNHIYMVININLNIKNQYRIIESILNQHRNQYKIKKFMNK